MGCVSLSLENKNSLSIEYQYYEVTQGIAKEIIDLLVRSAQKLKSKDFLSKKKVNASNSVAKVLTRKVMLVIESQRSLFPGIINSVSSRKTLIPKTYQSTLEAKAQELQTLSPQYWEKFSASKKHVKSVKHIVRQTKKHPKRYKKTRLDADDYIDDLMKRTWEYQDGVRLKPIPGAIPIARRTLLKLLKSKDDYIKKKVLLSLIDLFEWDTLEKDSGNHLPKVLKKLILEEMDPQKFEKYNSDFRWLFIKTFMISVDLLVFHVGEGNITSLTDLTVGKMQANLTQLKKLCASAPPEVNFMLEYGIQGLERIDTDKNAIMEWIGRLAMVARAGYTLVSVYNNPGEGIAGSVEAFTDLYKEFETVHWEKKWFGKLSTLKQLCRFSLDNPKAFQRVSAMIKQEGRSGCDSELMLGFSLILEYVVVSTKKIEIKEEVFKLLVHPMFTNDGMVQEGVIRVFFRLMDSGCPRISQTAFTMLMFLKAAERVSKSLIIKPMKINKTDIYRNPVKYLLMDLGHINSSFDWTGESFVTMLCISDEKIVLPALLRTLREICPGFQEPDCKGRTPYHILIREGHYDKLEVINSELETDINAKEDENGNTPLHEAVLKKSERGISYLLNLSAKVDIKNNEGNTPLHLAVHAGKRYVEAVLKKTGEVNLSNRREQTALNLAIEKDHPEMVELIVEAGGQVDKESENMTPIMLAAVQQKKKVLERLIRKKMGEISFKESIEIMRLILRLESVHGTDDFWTFHQDFIGQNTLYAQHFQLSREKKQLGETMIDKYQRSCFSLSDIGLKEGEPRLTKNDIYERTPLHIAVLHKNHRGIPKLATSEEVVNARDFKGFTPLHMAAYLGDGESVRILTAHGADPAVLNDDKESPFMIACGVLPYRKPMTLQDDDASVPESNPEERVLVLECLKENGVNINQIDSTKSNGLHRAMATGCEEVIYWLVKENQQLMWQKNAHGFIPIDLATQANRKIKLEPIWKNNRVNWNQQLRNATGLTLGNIMVICDDLRPFLDFLNDHPKTASQNDDSKERKTPLHLAASDGKVEVLEPWRKAGLSLDIPNASLNTAAHIAVMKGQSEFLNALIKSGANLSLKNDDGHTPLHLAAMTNHLGIVKLLASRSGLVYEVDSRGNTPMHLAASHGNTQIAKELYRKDLPLNGDENTPLHIACMLGQVNIVELLLEQEESLEARNSSQQTPLILAAQEGFEQVILKLLQEGANLFAKDDRGQIPLQKAVFNRHIQAVAVLLEWEKTHRTLMNTKQIESEDNDGERALHKLAKTNSSQGDQNAKRVLTKLLEHGADPFHADRRGETFFHEVAYYGKVELLEETIRKYWTANYLSLRDLNRNTLLDKAVEGRQLKMIVRLCKYKVNLNITNSEGRTALMEAVSKGYWEIASTLLKYNADSYAADKKGQTILHLFFQHKTITEKAHEFLKKIVTAFPELIYKKDKRNRNVFHELSENKHANCLYILEYLPNNPAKNERFLKKKDEDGFTPLDVAGNYKDEDTPTARKIRLLEIEKIDSKYQKGAQVEWVKDEEEQVLINDSESSLSVN